MLDRFSLSLSLSLSKGRRRPRQFRPTIGSSVGGAALEPRFLAAAVFVRRLPFVAALRTGAQSQTGTVIDNEWYGFGGGFDGGYVTDPDPAHSEAEAKYTEFDPYTNQNVLVLKLNEEGTVTNQVTGPGSGLFGDPNPGASSQIQINVTHDHTDTVTNYTSGPLSTGTYSASAEQSTGADTNNEDLTYDLSNGGGTVTLTFHASYTESGSSGFGGVPYLDFESSFLDVSIDIANGLVATDFNGNVVENEPNFVSNNLSTPATLTVPNVPNGTDLNIRYTSSLDTAPDSTWPFPPGVSANNTTFDWSMTVDVS